MAGGGCATAAAVAAHSEAQIALIVLNTSLSCTFALARPYGTSEIAPAVRSCHHPEAATDTGGGTEGAGARGAGL